MIPKAYDNFINRLIEATEENSVSWEERVDDTLVCRQKGTTISIFHHFDEDSEKVFYVFNYHNIDKDKKSGFKVSNEYNDFEIMERLYAAAQANAHGIEDELDDFFE